VRSPVWIAGRDAPKTPAIRPVVENATEAALAWFTRVKAFPINHMVVLKSATIDAHPWLPQEVFGLLKRGKRAYLADLGTRPARDPDEAYRKDMLVAGGDPLPFGIDALRTSLRVVIDYAFAQKVIPRKYAVEELFACAALCASRTAISRSSSIARRVPDYSCSPA
jgi:4,5-dihydroxyphthalate decarboxylase